MATYDETSPAYALYIDGTLICATKEQEELTSVLEGYKNEYALNIEGAVLDFYQNVEIKEEYVPFSYLCSKEDVYGAITATQEEQIEYIVQPDDTMWDIAMKNDITVDEIMELNPEMTDLIREGDAQKILEQSFYKP